MVNLPHIKGDRDYYLFVIGVDVTALLAPALLSSLTFTTLDHWHFVIYSAYLGDRAALLWHSGIQLHSLDRWWCLWAQHMEPSVSMPYTGMPCFIELHFLFTDTKFFTNYT